MFPVWINDGVTEPPDADIYYNVSKDGIYLHKKMGFFNSVVKVPGIGILEDTQQTAHMDIKKLDAKKFSQVLYLFREVAELYRAEANIILHYNPKRKRFRIEVPDQGVSGASVDYVSGDELYKGYIRIGTIHSHVNMSAFHSGTDQHDEEGWDGLHITLGKIGHKKFEISCSIMANNQRFMVDPNDYIEGLVTHQVKKPKTVYGKWSGHGYIYDSIDEEDDIDEYEYKYTLQEEFMKFPRTWLKHISRTIPERLKNRYTWGIQQPKVNVVKPGAVPSGRNGNSNDKPFSFTDMLMQGHDNGFFGGGSIADDDWNPCEQCPYLEYKVDIQLSQLMGGAEVGEDDDKLKTNE